MWAAVRGSDCRHRQRLRPWDGLSGPLPLILCAPGHAAGQRDGQQLRPGLRPPAGRCGLHTRFNWFLNLVYSKAAKHWKCSKFPTLTNFKRRSGMAWACS